MRLEKKIKNYIYFLYEHYPRFFKYLELNNEISKYILQIYYSNIIPTLEYKTNFHNSTSVSVAFEIINSISVELANMFIDKIDNGDIYFTKEDISYTDVYDGKIYSKIIQQNTIHDPIILVHEFFHKMHGEIFNLDLYKEECYFFSEIFGLLGDIYSCFYLMYVKKEYVEDSKAFLSKFFSSLVTNADIVLLRGRLIDIYNNYNSLKKSVIKDYVDKNNLSSDYLNIIKLNNDVNDYQYHESATYIFSFPTAFKLSVNLLCEENYSNKFTNMFLNINKYKPEEWLHKLDLDTHFDNSEELLNIMNNIYHNIKDVYGENKVKKLGGL